MEENKFKEVEIPEISTSAENTLTTVGGIILALGIIATVILACTTLKTKFIMAITMKTNSILGD